MKFPYTILFILVEASFALHHDNASWLKNLIKASNKIEKKVIKRAACQDVNYYPSSSNFCCRKCDPGYFVSSHCTQENGISDCKACDEGHEYMDHPNGMHKCLACTRCESMENMDEDQNCTATQDTKCRCKKKFFCSSTPPCKSCQPCRECPYGVQQECNSTANSICINPDEAQRTHIIAYSTAPVIIVAFFLFICCIRLRKAQQLKNTPTTKMHECQEVPLIREELPADLAEIDLEPYLHDIVDFIGEVKRFVRKNGLKAVEVDQTVSSYPNNIQEQNYQLMHRWYQKQRKKGALCTLCDGLRKMNLNMAADKIIELVKSSTDQHNIDAVAEIRNES